MSVSSQARQRIDSLLDAGSFVEIGAQVSARNTDFNMQAERAPSDGVITGYGLIDGRLVYVYSQDADVLAGSVGEMHAMKIVRIYDLALKMGAPVIGLIDSSGMRLQEATDAMRAFGDVCRKQVDASGVVPQISVVYGNCGGGLAMMSALSDFTFVETEKGRLFMNTPDAVTGNYKEKCDTASAAFRSSHSADIDLTCAADLLAEEVRHLIGFLPSNNEDDDSFTECEDDLNRSCGALDTVAADPAHALRILSDSGQFFETKRDFAPEMVTGFIRLNGQTIGVIANRSALLDDDGKATDKFDTLLSSGGCDKASRLVRFCDAFNIPMLTMVNVTGFAASMEEETQIAHRAAALFSALACATTPKVSLVTKEAFGSAAVVMNAVGGAADMKICWPEVKIGPMRAEYAAKILGDGKDEAAVSEIASSYDKLQSSVAGAATHAHVDEIIEPADTRKYLIGAFEMLYSKRENRPAKKHGTV